MVADTRALSGDTETELSNGARFMAPKNWSLKELEGGFVIGAPEEGSAIAILSRNEEDPDAAVAAAWAAWKPDAPRAGAGDQRSALEGWDRTLRYRYMTTGNEPRSVMALALGKGKGWTVLLQDITDAVSERRDAQLEVIFNSLLPSGYLRESLAGRPANPLDAQRIEKLTAMIEAARKEFGIPGVALGLIQNGKVVFAGGFGVREAGRTDPVDADTLFNVASIGKAWTTLMLAKQVDEGTFGWDTPVRSRWPEFALGDPATVAAVKVRHLVCACTGMPRNDYQWLFEGEASSPAEIMAILAQSQPTSAFGDTYQYSNLMAAAGGFFGGHIRYPREELGSAYDRAMQELVFDPLGMSATTANFDQAMSANHATGHALDVDGNVVVASQGLNLAAISTRPSGNHWSNVRDILRYMQMELARGALPDRQRYIGEEALLIRSEPFVTEGLNEHYGMGLKIDRQWGVRVIHHGGSTAGYRAHMMWLPDHNTGAVILINSDTGGALRTAFRRRLLEILFDGVPKAEADLARFALLDREALAEERQILAVPADSAAVATLATHYRSPDLGELRVYRTGANVWFDFGGWKSELASVKLEGENPTFMTISPGMNGYVFEALVEDGKRVLLTREAQRTYRFEEVE
jgi:CubicO group peptidase (beta-lactamase class C family)